MSRIYVIPIDEESMGAMEEKYQAILEELRAKHPNGHYQYRRDVETVSTTKDTNPYNIAFKLKERLPAALEVRVAISPVNGFVDSVTECLKEKGISHGNPIQFKGF